MILAKESLLWALLLSPLSIRSVQAGFVTPNFASSATNKDTKTQRYVVLDKKPTHVEIEQAAGQHVPTTEKRDETAAIQGSLSHKPEECCRYGCEVQDEKLKARFERLIEPRPYPLFLMEKGVKVMGDLIPKAKREPLKRNDVQRETKEQLVILGAGWGAAALLQDIDTDRYDVTCISPRNYFLFTPMLAGASVGTVDVRSITRPIREFNLNANYLEAAASKVDTKTRTITCLGVSCDDECDIKEFTVPYDRLVVAVGARINTFGIPGVEEHCLFLKQLDDARQVRRKIINLFEQANFPSVSEETRRQLLTFAVIGAGPTGVEFAAELRDFIEEDGPKYYPQLLKYVSLKVIEATPVILRPFDESLREAAIDAMSRKVHKKDAALASLFPENLTELLINKKVQEVTSDEIILEGGTKIPYGLAVWAGGIGPLPITLDIINSIGGRQVEAQKIARGKIGVDPWLRAVNSDGRVFALGDCACTQGQCLPSTAQVASQEGEFLAHLLSTANLTTAYEDGLLLPPRSDPTKKNMVDSISSFATQEKEYMAPFQFLDMGILAYTGTSSALAQVQVAPEDKSRLKISGRLGFGLWRSVYFMKQASFRNRFTVAVDWLKARLFGRDITTID